MATGLPSKLPGGRRRFKVRATTRATAFSKSPTLSTPKGRQSFSNGGRPGTIVQPVSVSEEDGDDENIEQAPANDAIQPDFLKQAEGDEAGDEAGKGKNTDDVAKKESEADASDGNSTATNKKEEDLSKNEEDGGWDNNTSPKKAGLVAKSIQRRKQMMIGGILLGVAGALGSVILAVPVLLANTLSDLLTGKVGQVEISHQQKFHRRAFGGPVSGLLTKDGRRGAKLIADMELRGYRFEFDGSRKITSMRAPGGAIITDLDEIGNHFGNFMDSKFKFFRATWKTKGADALYRRFGISQDSVVKPKTRDPNKTAKQQVTSDLAEAADAGTADIEYNPRDPPDDADEATTDQIEGEEAERASLAEKSDVYDEARAWLIDGNQPEDFPNQTLMQSFMDPDVNPSDIDLVQQILDGRSGITKVAGFAGGLLNSTDILAKLCTINKALKGAVLAARVYRSIGLANAAFRYVSADDAVRRNEASSDLMRELFKRVVTPDASGGYFGSGAGYSLAMNGSFNKARNDEKRSAYSLDAKLTGWQKHMESASGWVEGCSLWTNPYAQGAIAVGEIVLSIFSFGGTKAASTAAVQGVKELVEQGVAKSMSRIITSKITRGIATGAAIDIGFDQAIQLTKLYTEKTLVGSLSVATSSGGLLSDQLTTGMGAARAVQSAEAGLPVATTEVFSAALDQYYAEKKENLKQQSVFTRLFDMDNVDSLAFNSVSKVAFGGGLDPGTIGNTPSNIASVPGSIFSTIASSITGTSSAQGAEMTAYDTYVTEGDNSGVNIATNHAGTPRRALTPAVERYITIENADYLVSRGDVETTGEGEYSVVPDSDLDEFMKVCVDPIDVLTSIEEGYDCIAEGEEAQRWYAFVGLQNTLENYLGSYEHPEEISDGGNSVPLAGGSVSTSAPVNISGMTGPVVPCQGQPKMVARGPFDSADWGSIVPTGTIGNNLRGQPINVYIRASCSQQNAKTIVIAGSIHGSENGGQLVAQEMLFNANLPPDVRVIAIPKICACAGSGTRSANDVDLNRNYNFNWSSLPQSQTFESGNTYNKGPNPESEPETQALVSFLNTLGPVNLFAVYHDSLNYIAPVGDTPLELAQIYAATTGMQLGNDRGSTYVNQGGSLDGWYNQQTSSPTFLVEFGSNQSDSVIQSHVQALIDTIEAAP